ncbi:hypothetical protein HZA38_04245 [Candidatus Peregrinibacteria bacterium]|nr:hypothetical protein [Candidatus Peregrinibacteria bacterium]
MKRTFFFLSIFSVILAVNISVWYFSSNHLSSAEAMGESADVLPQGGIGIESSSGMYACESDSGSLPSSANLKTDAPWSTVAFPLHTWEDTKYSFYTDGLSSKPEETFVDINGDGLADYIYRHHYLDNRYSVNQINDCVFLNNGSGWDMVFKCSNLRDPATGQTRWYGDCAQQ